MRKHISILLTFIFLLLLSIPVHADTLPDLDAQAYILIEMQTGQILLNYNSDTHWAPASTTKIMTALVALEHADLDKIMTASGEAINSIGPDYVTAGIRPGEELTLKDLLKFMLITSANESANIIAENISPTGDIDGFIQLMNQKAVELGLQNTHFQNAFGYDNEMHYSSAHDLAMIGKAAMQIQAFRDIVGSKSIPAPETNFHKSDQWPEGLHATNWLISNTSDYKSEVYSHATGIKTGYTDDAGRCLVSSAVNDKGLEYIAVVLGEDSYEQLFSDSKTLLEYGFENFSFQNVVRSGQSGEKLPVMDAEDDIKVQLLTRGEIVHLLPNDETLWDIEFRIHLDTPFKAPVEKGQILGRRDYYYKDEFIGSTELVADNNIEKKMSAKIRDRYKEIISNPILHKVAVIAVGCIIGFIILRITLRSISRKVNKKNRRLKRSQNYRINRFR